MPIYDSSKDYGTNEVTVLWDGDRPTLKEFHDYVGDNYGMLGKLKIEVEMPSECKGFKNPGVARIKEIVDFHEWRETQEWGTMTGEKILVKDLSDYHVVNIIHNLQNRVIPTVKIINLFYRELQHRGISHELVHKAPIPIIRDGKVMKYNVSSLELEEDTKTRLYKNILGQPHRLDGPSIIDPMNDTKFWCINGKVYASSKEFCKDAGFTEEETMLFILKHGLNL